MLPTGKNQQVSLPGSQDLRVFASPAGQLPQPSRALPQIHYPAYQVPEGAQATALHLIIFLEPGLEVASLQEPPAHLVPPNCFALQSDLLPGTCWHTGLPDSSQSTFLPIPLQVPQGLSEFLMHLSITPHSQHGAQGPSGNVC